MTATINLVKITPDNKEGNRPLLLAAPELLAALEAMVAAFSPDWCSDAAGIAHAAARAAIAKAKGETP